MYTKVTKKAVIDTKSVTGIYVSQIGKIKASQSLWEKAGRPICFCLSFRRPEMPEITPHFRT